MGEWAEWVYAMEELILRRSLKQTHSAHSAHSAHSPIQPIQPIQPIRPFTVKWAKLMIDILQTGDTQRH